MSTIVMVQLTDIPAQVAHLDMLYANMVSCDKAYSGGAISRQAAIDCLEMTAIVWGGKENLKRQVVMAAVVHSMSPLKYSAEAAESIIDMAHLDQPLVIPDSTTVTSG